MATALAAEAQASATAATLAEQQIAAIDDEAAVAEESLDEERVAQRGYVGPASRDVLPQRRFRRARDAELQKLEGNLENERKRKHDSLAARRAARKKQAQLDAAAKQAAAERAAREASHGSGVRGSRSTVVERTAERHGRWFESGPVVTNPDGG